MDYKEIENYFLSLGKGLKKVAKTCDTWAEFMELKADLPGLTFMLEDMDWKPAGLGSTSRKDVPIYFQLWLPLVDHLDAKEVIAAKELLMECTDQITARLIYDQSDPSSEDHGLIKGLDLDSIDFQFWSDAEDLYKLGVRGQVEGSFLMNFEINEDLWTL